MNRSERFQMLQILRSHQSDIATRWYEAIIQIGSKLFEESDIRLRLATLTETIISLLFTDPFEGHKAQLIGEILFCLSYVQPEILPKSQEVLQFFIIENLPNHFVALLQPRLNKLLDEITIGFLRQSRMVFLAEQAQKQHPLTSQRKQIKDELNKNRLLHQAMFTGATIGIALVDMGGRFVESNPAMQRMLGYGEEELRTRTFLDIVHPHYVNVIISQNENLLRGIKDHYQIEIGYLHKDSRIMYGHLTVSPIRGIQEDAQLNLLMIEDITERRRVEATLHKTRSQLYWSREMERRHIAHELHDEVIQQLLGISYQLTESRIGSNAQGQFTSPPSHHTAPSMSVIRQEILNVIAQLREMISELRPAGLEEFGLYASLESYIADLHRRREQEIPCIELALPETEGALPKLISLCVFRIVQEALRNALKHAHAHRILVQLDIFEKELVLSIDDDGEGFVVPEHFSLLTQRNHFGLASMAERVALFHGRFSIEAQPGQGTHIRVYLPVKEEDEDNEYSYSSVAS